MKKVIIWTCILCLFPASILPKGKKYRFGPVRNQNGAFLINFEVRDLMNEDILTGLQKGMTAALEYEVQLWKLRPRWADELVAEQIVRMKINYDAWQRRYVLETPDDEPQLMNEDQIQQRCSQLIDFPLTEVGQLESRSNYMVSVRLIMQPMSVENYEEIKRWLSGNVKQLDPKKVTATKEPGKKAGNWLMGLVLNLTGFGDRVISAKSPAFSWHEGSVTTEGME